MCVYVYGMNGRTLDILGMPSSSTFGELLSNLSDVFYIAQMAFNTASISNNNAIYLS